MMWMTKDFRKMENRHVESWNEAMHWASKMNQQRYGGYSDWRVPSVEEYQTIYDAQKPRLSYKGKPVGNPEAFEDGSGIFYWSNQDWGGGVQKAEAWGMHFSGRVTTDGALLWDKHNRSKNHTVRLVRKAR